MFLFTTIDRSDTVQSALTYASTNTGVDFDYLLDTARRESSLDPQAKARTSSASGLFQFIESTWLATLKEAGPRHGYGELADKIEPAGRGRYMVSDPGVRGEILALRNDPKAAALMAGELTRMNGESLERAIGRKPTPGELYIAHFLGARGASELLQLVHTAPHTPAAESFPAAARANRPIFYTGDGNPRSAQEVYANLVARHGAERGRVEERRQVNDPAALEMAYASGRNDVEQIFHGMFADVGATGSSRHESGLGPIAAAVGSFWTGLFTTIGADPPAVSSADAGTQGAGGAPGVSGGASVLPQDGGNRPHSAHADPSLRGLW